MLHTYKTAYHTAGRYREMARNTESIPYLSWLRKDPGFQNYYFYAVWSRRSGQRIRSPGNRSQNQERYYFPVFIILWKQRFLSLRTDYSISPQGLYFACKWLYFQQLTKKKPCFLFSQDRKEKTKIRKPLEMSAEQRYIIRSSDNRRPEINQSGDFRTWKAKYLLLSGSASGFQPGNVPPEENITDCCIYSPSSSGAFQITGTGTISDFNRP